MNLFSLINLALVFPAAIKSYVDRLCIYSIFQLFTSAIVVVIITRSRKWVSQLKFKTFLKMSKWTSKKSSLSRSFLPVIIEFVSMESEDYFPGISSRHLYSKSVRRLKERKSNTTRI